MTLVFDDETQALAVKRAEVLRTHVNRIERYGHVGMGYPLEPHDLELLEVMRGAADLLERVGLATYEPPEGK